MSTPILNQITAARLSNEDKIFMLKNTNLFSDDIKSSIFSLRYQWLEETGYKREDLETTGSSVIRSELIPEQEFNCMKHFITDITTVPMPKDTNEKVVEYYGYVDKCWRKYSYNSGLALTNDTMGKVLLSTLSDIFVHYAIAYDIRTKLEESDITRYDNQDNLTPQIVKCGLMESINLVIDMATDTYGFTAALFNLIKMLDATNTYHQFINVFITYGVSHTNGYIKKDEVMDLLDSVLGENPTKDIMDILDKVDDTKVSKIWHFPSYSNTVEVNTKDLLYSVVNDGFTVYGDAIAEKTPTEINRAIQKLTPDTIKTYIGNREPLFDFPGELFNPRLLNIIFDKHYKYCIYENKDGIHRLLVEIDNILYCMFRLFEASDCVFGISTDMDEDESRKVIKIPVPKEDYKLKVGDSVWQ